MRHQSRQGIFLATGCKCYDMEGLMSPPPFLCAETVVLFSSSNSPVSVDFLTDKLKSAAPRTVYWLYFGSHHGDTLRGFYRTYIYVCVVRIIDCVVADAVWFNPPDLQHRRIRPSGRNGFRAQRSSHLPRSF